tara:strand:- start:84 stop:434 length:351 start_codon:yes stop_codon:yes gene_type:complete
MAVTKTWDIAAMDSAPTEGSLSDVVKTIHWNCRGTETVGSGESAVTYNSYSYGCIGLADADASSFTDFASITKDNAIAWVQAALGTDEVTNIENGLEAKITEQKTPSIETKTLPWT